MRINRLGEYELDQTVYLIRRNSFHPMDRMGYVGFLNIPGLSVGSTTSQLAATVGECFVMRIIKDKYPHCHRYAHCRGEEGSVSWHAYL